MSVAALTPTFLAAPNGQDTSTFSFSQEQFDRMIAAGVIPREEKVFLSNGHLYRGNLLACESAGKARPATYGFDDSEYRISLDQYEQLISTGILSEDARVEFLDRLLVKQMPISPRHAGTTHLIGRRISRRLPEPWEVRSQSPVRLGEMEPQPDLAIVRGEGTLFLSRHPLASEIGLIIEVADTSLLRDQRDKSRIYADAGIPAYWVVNLIDYRIEAYADPDQTPAYRSVTFFSRGESIPLMLDGQVIAEISTDDLLAEPAPGTNP